MRKASLLAVLCSSVLLFGAGCAPSAPPAQISEPGAETPEVSSPEAGAPPATVSEQPTDTDNVTTTPAMQVPPAQVSEPGTDTPEVSSPQPMTVTVPPASPPAPAQPVQAVVIPTAPAGYVRMLDKGFMPVTVTVPKGSTVLWKNDDAMAHTVTADDKSWDSGAIKGGATFSRKFDKPGTYAYHCAYHGGMRGAVVVTK